MIAKRISMKSARKSSFRGLVHYLIHGQGKAVRVGEIGIRNCHSEDPNWAALEVKAVQAQNTRAESDKTYHLIISFRSGENPPPEVLKAIEERICNGLGYSEHQRVSVIHTDTDNLHIHLAINKIHPIRHTIHEPYRDHKKLADLCATLEAEYGLERDNHTPKRTAGQSKGADMETAAGIESLIGWIHRHCLEDILAAGSWEELHRTLGEHGLEIRERGNGLVIADREGTAVKASSVSRNCSKKALEARLGKFQPLPEAREKEPAKHRYVRKPLHSRVDTTELYAAYQNERSANLHSRGLDWKNAKANKDQRINQAKRTARLKRNTLRLAGSGASKRILYGHISQTLQEEIARIKQEYLTERQAIYEKYKRYTWHDWLKIKAHEGNATALEVLRAREVRTALKGNSVGSEGPVIQPGTFPGFRVDSVTKKGTVIYHVAATTIRDAGKLLQVEKGASQEGITVALRMAMHRYGETITVNGSSAFKDLVAMAAATARLQIRFDDPTLEQRRVDLSAVKVFCDVCAEQYIQERNEKRERISDILEHRAFCSSDAGTAEFRGLRQVNGRSLALLQRDQVILVLPVESSTAASLKRLGLGEEVGTTINGEILIKRRTRVR